MKLRDILKKNKNGENGAGENDAEPARKKSKKKIVIAVCAAAAVAAGAASFGIVKHNQKGANEQIAMVTAERRNIMNTVTGSSSVEPNDSYDVSAMTAGEVVSDSFNEGDKVKKDQVLYQIEAADAQNSVDSAQNSLRKAQMSYEDAIYNNKSGSAEILKAKDSVLNAEQSLADAVRNLNTKDSDVQKALISLEKTKRSYQESQKNAADLNVVSQGKGTVKEVFVSEGDNVNANAKIAEVYNDKYLKLVVPFNSADAENIKTGMGASVRASGESGEIYGTVTNVSAADVATESRAIVRYVTIELENPGALSASDSGSAAVAGISCQDTAKFEYINTFTISAKTSGKVESLNIDEYDMVYQGTVAANLSSDSLMTSLANAGLDLESSELSLQDAIQKSSDSSITNDNNVKKAQRELEEAKASYEKTLRSQNNSVTSAALELDNAKLQLNKAKKQLENYTIKAPIEGTVVTKNIKAGDKLENSGSNSNTSQMAVIYDLSSLCFELAIDETSIRKVKVGQEVSITADAVEGMFKGVVEKVGVNGTASNGVTTYPVKVRINEYGDLLPGMNVDASIVVERAENVVAVPVSSVNRGNVVYVKGEKTDEDDHAPDGFKSIRIETGINDSDYIEVKSGLNEGDEIRGARSASGNETSGTAEAQQQGMPGMGGMPGGMPGGGMPGGGMPGGMGGSRNGGMQGGANRGGMR